MADWRQIQARIRKAKNSADAPAKLSELYGRTRDAMVAWELGALEEKAEHKDQAGDWYTIAAQHFRRSDWKKKAEEALIRLGRELPPPQEKIQKTARVVEVSESLDAAPQSGAETAPEIVDTDETEEISLAAEDAAALASHVDPSSGEILQSPRKKRRRGRRGGRGRRRKDAATPSGLPAQAFTAATLPPPAVSRPLAPSIVPGRQDQVTGPPLAPVRPAAVTEAPVPRLSSERSAQSRAGDPALASRMAQLESMLRRLVTSAPHRLEELDDAPASPGVFLLSDSDQITSYYVESCQTLRIACGNLARTGRGGKNPRAGRGYSETGLKERLGEYLGISETKVSQYMKDHCVIRWIQLDDEAPLLAHFAIGVLRTPLNLE
jgi:hypothetical protein